MELPNLFGLHIQASRAGTLAKAYIGNFLAIENRSSRLAPNGGDENTSAGVKTNVDFDAFADQFSRVGVRYFSWPLMVGCRRSQSNWFFAAPSRRLPARSLNGRGRRSRNRLCLSSLPLRRRLDFGMADPQDASNRIFWGASNVFWSGDCDAASPPFEEVGPTHVFEAASDAEHSVYASTKNRQLCDFVRQFFTNRTISLTCPTIGIDWCVSFGCKTGNAPPPLTYGEGPVVLRRVLCMQSLVQFP